MFQLRGNVKTNVYPAFAVDNSDSKSTAQKPIQSSEHNSGNHNNREALREVTNQIKFQNSRRFASGYWSSVKNR